MQRTVFFVSDGTGITAESFGQSLLAQFEGYEFQHVTCPYIDSAEKTAEIIGQIHNTHKLEQIQPIVFMTVLIEEVSEALHQSGAYIVDLFKTFLPGLEQQLGEHPLYKPGKKRSTTHSHSYHRRIEAVQFALDNDDGARTRHYDKADIILLGASRSGKTPTCIYLGLQFGIFAANYPITEEDFEGRLTLPKPLEPYREKLFGLTINANRLAGIRHERRPNSRYSSSQQCQYEIQTIEQLYRRQNIKYLNTTDSSIEEIATRVMSLTDLRRRLK